MVELRLTGVTKTYPGGAIALDHLSLDVGSGELLALLGPSGSGKTTTLRLVAGLDAPTGGRIHIDDVDVTDWPAERRDVGMVFQHSALYPHLTVARNVGFALGLRKLPRDEIDRRVRAEARALGFGRLLHRLPGKLSAGERQAAALGRATARTPQLFCMDEPLALLDPGARLHARSELAQLQAGLRITTLYVTNDQAEAMALADRLAILDAGVLQQLASPQDCYDRPNNLFVATFLGTPTIGTFPAQLHTGARRSWLVVGDRRIPLEGRPQAALHARDGQRLLVGVRPEHTRLAASAPATLPCTIDRVEHHGAFDMLAVTPAHTGASALHARADPGHGLHPGASVHVAVDEGKLHLFDPDTGATIWHAGTNQR